MIDNQDLVVTSSIGKRKQAVAFVSLCKPVNNQPVILINELPAPLYLQFNSKFFKYNLFTIRNFRFKK